VVSTAALVITIGLPFQKANTSWNKLFIQGVRQRTLPVKAAGRISYIFTLAALNARSEPAPRLRVSCIVVFVRSFRATGSRLSRVMAGFTIAMFCDNLKR
jgi:hypothetical protein